MNLRMHIDRDCYHLTISYYTQQVSGLKMLMVHEDRHEGRGPLLLVQVRVLGWDCVAGEDVLLGESVIAWETRGR